MNPLWMSKQKLPLPIYYYHHSQTSQRKTAKQFKKICLLTIYQESKLELQLDPVMTLRKFQVTNWKVVFMKSRMPHLPLTVR